MEYSENKNAKAIHDSMTACEKAIDVIEDLIYECTILLAQAQCFDFLREIDKKEGRVVEEMMTDEKR